jgi:hypothetical protein
VKHFIGAGVLVALALVVRLGAFQHVRARHLRTRYVAGHSASSGRLLAPDGNSSRVVLNCRIQVQSPQFLTF